MGESWEEEEEGPKEIFTKHLRLFIFLIETNVFVVDDAGGWQWEGTKTKRDSTDCLETLERMPAANA